MVNAKYAPVELHPQPSAEHSTLYIGSISSIVVLLFNMSFVLWAVTHRALVNGRGVLFTGECDKARNINRSLHLLINILSTVLLSASNYGMQCLSSPTRKDIDRAHPKNKWLDIGAPGMRNLSSIPRKKALLWTCLVLSSLPLHLIYNSAIFLTMSSYGYLAYISDKPLPDFVTGSPRLSHVSQPSTGIDEWYSTYQRLQNKAAKGQIDLLDNKDCISAYATSLQSKHGSLLIQTDDFNSTTLDIGFLTTNDVKAYAPQKDPYSWICDYYLNTRDITDREADTPFCSSMLSTILSDPGSWSVTNTSSSCWSERLPDVCKVEYSLVWAVVVMACNVAKAGILCGLSLSLKDMPILTTGDAVVSFLQNPDPTTRGECLLSGKSADRDIVETTFSKRPRRWASAVSKSRWVLCMALFLASICVCVGLLIAGLMGIQDTNTIWKSGISTVNSQTMISPIGFPTTLLPVTIIVNTPQAVFSMIYFTTNAIFSTMVLSKEWTSYALQRKGLRVSTAPKGSQRSTYFLSLPYRYALPLLALSTLLHWLISESLFLVSVEMYDATLARVPSQDLISCGYSPPAIVICLSTSCLLIAYLVGIGCRRFKTGMPVAGSCSLAISAACHFDVQEMKDHGRESGSHNEVLLYEEQPVETLPLKWGVVPFYGEGVGHCAFSSVEVETPKDGERYD
ncbi:hypothetical protein BDV27DRAFT_172402 [Aspergillus caelatus]|uniref:DUF6536 domain-containing protein n=1 Tax=Aspergillus caelatus TaxID=61420 RepID=A0A5N7AIP4_9EURO|nr:uncharacterized protein BDV27DRAFT_172402 [Aspergillus caelatus]KAE8369751.1 hypothetical protein BDV27DRAFT_172402 [Aspergillus caelatus]